MKKTIIFLLLFITSQRVLAQGVGINTTSLAADPSAMLDIDNATQGVLISRVNLTATNIAAPVTTPANSLLVYNLATTGSGATAVTPGFYFWNSNASEWTRIVAGNGLSGTDDQNLTSATLLGDVLTINIENGSPVSVNLGAYGNSWKIDGNAGTNPTSNFIGTTDNQDFVLRTNNTEKARVTANGFVGIGTNAPTTILDVFGLGGFYNTINTNGRIITGDLSGFGGIWLNGSTYDAFVGNFITSFGFYTPAKPNALQIDKATGRIGVGTQLPSADVHIFSTTPGNGFRLQDGSEGAGKVLKSDATGTASWSPSGLSAPSATAEVWDSPTSTTYVYPNGTPTVMGPFSVTQTGWYQVSSRWFVIQNNNTGSGGSNDDGEAHAFMQITDDGTNAMDAGTILYESRVAITEHPCIIPLSNMMYLSAGTNYFVHMETFHCRSVGTGERKISLRLVQ
jgi:hypothetical protein